LSWRWQGPSTKPARVLALDFLLDPSPAAECRRKPARWLRALHVRLLGAGLLCAGLLLPLQARAQAEQDAWDADQPSEEEAPEQEASDEEADESEASTDEEGEPTPADATPGVPRQVAEEHRSQAATYRLPKERIWAPLTWAGGRMHGQMELDLGYARYEYPEQPDRPRETLHDLRGRFVLGPTFHYQFPDSTYFLNVVAQFVVWVQEQSNEYLINSDDVYVQFGNGKKWDLQVGRFMTWRVYHKGLGFDLFTLEDNGASKSFPISNNDFAVRTYEADYIFLRNSPYVGGEIAGRAALHYYPADILGFELAAAYGLADNRGSDTIGGRLAMDLQWDFLQLSAAGEYRRQAQTGPPNAIQNAGTPQERAVECGDCGASSNYGGGGGLRLAFAPVNLGGSFAIGWDEKNQLVGDAEGNPEPDDSATGRRMSFGGFFELDVGSWLLTRPLILGVGANRTELVLDNKNKEFHVQSAVYAVLPLGVNNALVKLVVSQAQADLYDATDPEGTAYIDRHPEGLAIRLRFSTNF
jgi:hypothetical protein